MKNEELFSSVHDLSKKIDSHYEKDSSDKQDPGDALEINRVKALNLFARMHVICEEIDRLDKEFPSGPDEPTHPRIVELIAEGEQVQKQLDPLVRERMRDYPEKLAEWDKIMHMCDDDDAKPEDESGSEKS
jgi:hypothetical protein